MFGEYIKEKRMGMGLTLRAFCMHNNEDPSNWSKMERGLLRPPTDDARLNNIARMLNMDSDDTTAMRDMACAESGRVPQDIMSDVNLVEHLPVMFRTIRNESLTGEQLDSLVEIIRKKVTPE